MISKIKIKTILPETVEVFSEKGNSLGKLNEMEFLDLRCQIKKYKIRGFYIYYDAEKVYIKKDGLLSKYVPIFEGDIYKRNYLLGISNKLYNDDTGKKKRIYNK